MVETIEPAAAIEEAVPETAPPGVAEGRLHTILAEHRRWLASGGSDGERAVLDNAEMHDADLREADLTRASLRRANVRDANLRHANLTGADLTGDVLDVANFYGATPRDADFADASLAGARGLLNSAASGLPDDESAREM